jgi:hypothetical protein
MGTQNKLVIGLIIVVGTCASILWIVRGVTIPRQRVETDVANSVRVADTEEAEYILPYKDGLVDLFRCDVQGRSFGLDSSVTGLPFSCNLNVVGIGDLSFYFKNIPTDTYSLDVQLVVKLNAQAPVSLKDADKGFSGGKELLSLDMDSSMVGHADAVSFKDINYDGVADLQVHTDEAAYNTYYRYYMYDIKNKTYILYPELANLASPFFDQKDKTITTFEKGRGMGDLYTKRVLSFENGTYVVTEIDQQSGIDDKAYKANPKLVYTHTIQKRIDGGLKTMYQKNETQEEGLQNSHTVLFEQCRLRYFSELECSSS